MFVHNLTALALVEFKWNYPIQLTIMNGYWFQIKFVIKNVIVIAQIIKTIYYYKCEIG